MVLANPRPHWPSMLGFGHYCQYVLNAYPEHQASTTTTCVPSLCNSLEMWGQLLSYFMDMEDEVQRTRETAEKGTQPSGHQG